MSKTIRAPSLPYLLAETRVLPELGRFLLSRKALADLPHGHRTILVIPGFGASDFHTRPLRRALSELGHEVHGWEMGINTGMSSELRNALAAKVSTLHTQREQKISLIGWSLGGVFVREMARHQPEHIEHIFTLGSPFNLTPAANNMLPLFRIMNRGRPVNLDEEGFNRRATPPPVQCTAIYSKTDGVVAWQTACEPEAENTENIEVHGSHFGMICNAEVVKVIAERLA